jgi:hypothetical protein
MDNDDGWGMDVTGDPALDRTGYQSPSRKGQNLTGFTPGDDTRVKDALAKSKQHREERRAQRASKTPPEVGSDEWRAARAAKWEAQGRLSPPQGNESSGERVEQKSAPVDRDEIAKRSLTELQPGQHGCFMEHREVRCWWAPWRKRMVWQQVSAWINGTPPRSAHVITVGSLDELDGMVNTIGEVGPSGTVVY